MSEQTDQEPPRQYTPSQHWTHVYLSPSLRADQLLPSKLLPEWGAHQYSGLQHAVCLSSEIWAVGPASRALPQTPHPSAQNNQPQNIKVQRKAKIGYVGKISKRLNHSDFTNLNLIWVKDLVICHRSKSAFVTRKLQLQSTRGPDGIHRVVPRMGNTYPVMADFHILQQNHPPSWSVCLGSLVSSCGSTYSPWPWLEIV